MFNMTNYEASPQMRDLAEANVSQARTAFATCIEAAKHNAELMKRSAEHGYNNLMGFYSRGFAYSEENVRAAFDHAQNLSRAGTLKEVMQLQMEFAHSQFASMQTQAKEFSGIVHGAIKESAEQAKTAMQEGLAQTRRAMEQSRAIAEQGADVTEHTMEAVKY